MSNANSAPREILLMGDVVRHVIFEPDPDDKTRPYKATTTTTGVGLLRSTICEALVEHGAINGRAEIKSVVVANFVSANKLPLIDPGQELVSVLDYFPQKSAGDQRVKNVLRVKEDYSATHLTLHPPATNGSRKEAYDPFPGLLNEPNEGSNTDRILVIDDRNSGLRKFITELSDAQDAQKVQKVQKLQTLARQANRGLVVAIRDNVDAGWLCTLRTTLKLDGETSKHTLVIVTADSLRKCGLNITEYGSLEEAVANVVGDLYKTPLCCLLDMSDHLVVVFRETGAIYLNMKTKKGSITICPNFDRKAQADSRTFGAMPGTLTIMLAAIVRQLYYTPPEDWKIDAALRLGVAGYNLHFQEGLNANVQYGITNPFEAVEKALSWKKRTQLQSLTTDPKKSDFLITSLPFEIDSVLSTDRPWSRLVAFFDLYPNKPTLEATLIGIVKDGLEKAFRQSTVDCTSPAPWFPKAVITCPYAEFGKIKTIDQKEIVGFLNLAKLISKYFDSEGWRTPLCLAVFGPPGAGKSFAVKEILKTVDPWRKSEPLTFNLAQFSSVDQLTDAFHKVQDRALSLQEVPLVIFDEFDSYFEGHLGWLKFFLAPMQDGLFRGKSGDYRVGRAIFLFSGGTCNSFEDFCKGLAPEVAAPGSKNKEDDQVDNEPHFVVYEKWKAQKQAEEKDNLKKVKLTDFISRLRGHLNVSDINSPDGRAPNKILKLRRAILLRSLLELHAEPTLINAKDGLGKIANIGDDVILKLLEALKYKYGVRSMEAIIQMSRWIEGHFVAASLPSESLLKSHVDMTDWN